MNNRQPNMFYPEFREGATCPRCHKVIDTLELIDASLLICTQCNKVLPYSEVVFESRQINNNTGLFFFQYKVLPSRIGIDEDGKYQSKPAEGRYCLIASCSAAHGVKYSFKFPVGSGIVHNMLVDRCEIVCRGDKGSPFQYLYVIEGKKCPFIVE